MRRKKARSGPGALAAAQTGLDQHRAGMRASALADATILGKAKPGLPYPRVQTDVADQLLGIGETPHVADRCDQAGSNDQTDAGD
jgi:hypothetical protein